MSKIYSESDCKSVLMKQIMGESGCIFNRIIRESLTEQAILAQRSEGVEKASHKDNWEKNGSGRSSSKCKGPEVRPWGLRNSSAGPMLERSEQREGSRGNEGREVTGNQIMQALKWRDGFAFVIYSEGDGKPFEQRSERHHLSFNKQLWLLSGINSRGKREGIESS